MFYNVENAFWPADDPERADDDFTPSGIRHWSMSRLQAKLKQLTRVILAAGGGRVPMLVGLAEVEGDSVMQYWTSRTPLRRTGLRYVVTQGPDVRGIQTALLYHPASFRLLHHDAFDVPMPPGERPTRQILHAAGRLTTGDTLDVIVMHQPSKLGGARRTQAKRDAARTVLLHLADSLTSVRHTPYIIVMGDMNENPQQPVLPGASQLVNLMYPLYQSLRSNPRVTGSHKFQGRWAVIDHFLVHPSLLDQPSDSIPPSDSRRSRLTVANARIFSLPFMLAEDKHYQGERPFRSFLGNRYEGGYSDHLPILLDLKIR